LTTNERRDMRQTLRASLERVGAVEDANVLQGQKRKRGLLPPKESPSFHLFEHEDVLLVDLQSPASRFNLQQGQRKGLRRTKHGPAVSTIPSGATWIDSWTPPPLTANQVAAKLADWDAGWNPKPGLKMWRNGKLLPVDPNDVSTAKKILLIIHGTFSSADAITTPLAKQKFLQRCLQDRRYDLILAFDHPSISVSPLINAVELTRALNGTEADIDVIAHSRGGLVTRWWLEALGQSRGNKRAVLFGSPLDGTSLATAGCLRGWMSWFANLNHAISDASDAVKNIFPPLTILSVLSRLGAVIGDVASKIPAIDVGVALAPGLMAMSRQGPELQRLNQNRKEWPQYFAVMSDFQPEGVGWKFWRVLQDQPILRITDVVADRLFQGPNDLVVDNASTRVLSAGGSLIKTCHNFGSNSKVFHLNYFEQPESLKFVATSFEIP
jgi:hypothetical protein